MIIEKIVHLMLQLSMNFCKSKNTLLITRKRHGSVGLLNQSQIYVCFYF